MAARFSEGGKLIAFGNGAGSTDAQHVAVEFVHPVIVGKSTLPAVALTGDVATRGSRGLGAGRTSAGSWSTPILTDREHHKIGEDAHVGLPVHSHE
jgi:D-sedoheptulose 7-phosphate isomerase